MMNSAQWIALMGSVAATEESESVAVNDASVTRLFRLADTIVDAWLGFLDSLGLFFAPVVKPLFQPINTLMENTYMPWARIFAVGMFVAAILWVWLVLKKDYVNLGREEPAWWTDLRVWTIISMLPHIFVYLYF